MVRAGELRGVLLVLAAEVVCQPVGHGEVRVEDDREAAVAGEAEGPVPELVVHEPLRPGVWLGVAPEDEARVCAALREVELLLRVVFAPVGPIAGRLARGTPRPVVEAEGVVVPAVQVHRDRRKGGGVEQGLRLIGGVENGDGGVVEADPREGAVGEAHDARFHGARGVHVQVAGGPERGLARVFRVDPDLFAVGGKFGPGTPVAAQRAGFDTLARIRHRGGGRPFGGEGRKRAGTGARATIRRSGIPSAPASGDRGEEEEREEGGQAGARGFHRTVS